jgi:hypothetical protein
MMDEQELVKIDAWARRAAGRTTVAKLVAEYRKLRNERDALRAALMAVEHVSQEDAAYCPWCDRWEGDPHAAGCQRQRALGMDKTG